MTVLEKKTRREQQQPIMTVQRVTQSPMNPQRWALDLSCGHEVWVTAKQRPKRMKAACDKCPAVQR